MRRNTESERNFRFQIEFSFQLYLAKFIPMVVAVVLGTFDQLELSIVLFGVHWGNPFYQCLIVVLSSAATAFGLMVYSIFDNIVVTIIAVFACCMVCRILRRKL